jgi:hypothetical protein
MKIRMFHLVECTRLADTELPCLENKQVDIAIIEELVGVSLLSNWIGHILRRNCLLKEVIEGKIKGRIEVTRRRRRRRKQLLDDLGDRRGYSQLKEEALDRIKWRNRFGRGFGPVV